MRSWPRSQVLGLAAVLLAVATALTTVRVVGAGAAPAARVSVIELDGATATAAPPSAAPRPPTASPTTAPAPPVVPATSAPPPAAGSAVPAPPPVPEPAPARTSGRARVVPPQPVPAGPVEDDGADDADDVDDAVGDVVGDDADDADDGGDD